MSTVALLIGAALLSGVAMSQAQESQTVPGAKSTPPPPGPQRPVQYPVPVETTLPNGLRVLAVRVPGSALVAADLTVAGGSANDPAATPGVASLVASLLSRGTAHRSSTDIALAEDALGATLTASATPERTDVTTDAVAARFPAALDILADVVRQPAFAAAEIVLAKQRATSSVALQSGSPANLATFVAQRALYAGAFGQPGAGTARSVAAIDRDAIVAFHRTYYRPDAAILTIGGDLAPTDAFALAQRAFGSWLAPSAAIPAAPVAKPAQARVIVVDQPTAGRTAIVIARTGPVRTAADWAAATIANAVLSGYSGRLNEEIRVKRGLSYGAGSMYLTGRYAGGIVASTLVTHAKAPEALDVMLTTVASLNASPLTTGELGARRTSLLGGIASSVETTGGLVRSVAANAFNGLPLDALTAGSAMLAAVEPAEVSRFAASSLVSPPVVVLVGDASQFLDAVRKAHPGVVVIEAADLDLASPTLTR